MMRSTLASGSQADTVREDRRSEVPLPQPDSERTTRASGFALGSERVDRQRGATGELNRARSMLTGSITTPYSAVDSFLYDLMFAPAVLQMATQGLAEVVELAPAGARILDVGCGGAQTALRLAALREDLELIGVDLCPGQVRRAIRRTRGLAQRMHFEVCDAMNLPFLSGSFDAVLSIAAIKHWPSMAGGLQECVRVLKPGGELCIVEVDRGCELDHARNLLSCSRVPRLIHPIALPLLRTHIIGRGLDMDGARALAAVLPLENLRVERTRDFAGVMLRGRLCA